MATGLLAAATWACLFVVAASAAGFDVPTVAFEERFSPLFGDGNLVRSSDDRSVRLLLDRRSGSGFISSDYYLHGFFSASIKLPKDYTAGVVVAFYDRTATAAATGVAAQGSFSARRSQSESGKRRAILAGVERQDEQRESYDDKMSSGRVMITDFFYPELLDAVRRGTV